MKKLLIFPLLILVLCLSACGKKPAKFDFMHDPSEITKIEIFSAYFTTIDDVYTLQMVPLCVIEDHDAFLEGLLHLECFSAHPPVGLMPTGEHKTIKFTYANGQYELVQSWGKAWYEGGETIIDRCSSTYFDDAPFVAFLDQYLDAAASGE